MSRIVECLADMVKKGLITSTESSKYERMHHGLQQYVGDKSAGRTVSELVAHEADQLVRKATAFDNVVGEIDRVIASSGTRGFGKADSLARELTLTKHIDMVDGNMSTFSVPVRKATAHLKDPALRKMEVGAQEDIARALMGDKSIKGEAKLIAEGMNESLHAIRTAIRKAGGAPFKDPPKNALALDIQRGALQHVTEKEFLLDIDKVIDKNHLLANVPAASIHPKGVDGYLGAVYRALKSGAKGLDVSELEGVSPSEYTRQFLQNAFTDNFEGWRTLQKKYGAGKRGRFNLLGTHQKQMQDLSETLAELDGFGGDLLRYGKAAKTSLNKAGVTTADTSIDSNIKFMRGGYDRTWSAENTSGFNRYIVKLTHGLNVVKAASPVKLMGGAQISAGVSDPLFRNKAMKYYGLKPKNFTQTLNAGTEAELGKILRENNAFVARHGLSTTHYSDVVRDTMRAYTGTYGLENVERWSSTALRSSGLPLITDVARILNLKQFSMNLAELTSKSFDDLHPHLQTDMMLFGTKSADWDIMLKHGITTEKGVPFMTPDALNQAGFPKQARQLASITARVQEMGTPTKSVQVEKFRAQVKSINPALGLIADMLTTFQGFNGASYERWLSRGQGQGGFIAKMAAQGYFLGLIDTTVRNMFNNKTTDYTNIDTHLQAFSRTGVFSFFGDIVMGAAGAIGIGFNQSMAEFAGRKASGVALGTMLDVGDALGSNMVKAVKGKETKFAGDLLRVIEGFNPLKQHAVTGELWDETIGVALQKFFLSSKQFNRVKNLEKARLKKAGERKIIEP